MVSRAGARRAPASGPPSGRWRSPRPGHGRSPRCLRPAPTRAPRGAPAPGRADVVSRSNSRPYSGAAMTSAIAESLVPTTGVPQASDSASTTPKRLRHRREHRHPGLAVARGELDAVLTKSTSDTPGSASSSLAAARVARAHQPRRAPGWLPPHASRTPPAAAAPPCAGRRRPRRRRSSAPPPARGRERTLSRLTPGWITSASTPSQSPNASATVRLRPTTRSEPFAAFSVSSNLRPMAHQVGMDRNADVVEDHGRPVRRFRPGLPQTSAAYTEWATSGLSASHQLAVGPRKVGQVILEVAAPDQAVVPAPVAHDLDAVLRRASCSAAGWLVITRRPVTALDETRAPSSCTIRSPPRRTSGQNTGAEQRNSAGVRTLT